MTLRWRLTLLYVAATAAVVAGALIALDAVYHQGMTASADRSLTSALDGLVERIETIGPAEAQREAIRQFAETHDSFYIQARRSDGISYSSDPDLPPLLDRLQIPPDGRSYFATIRLARD